MVQRKNQKQTRTTSTGTADPVLAYARGVVSGKIIAGPYVRAAGQRHLNDLQDGPARGLVWRLDEAMRAINFFSDVLRLPKIQKDEVSGAENIDTSASTPFVLEPSQAFTVGSLFGWYNDDGTRRFRTCYKEVGKGNGKSPEAAGVGLYMFVADGQANAEIYASAAVKDQAKIQYRDAVNMVDASEELQEIIQKHGEKEVYNMKNMRTNGFFKPISAEKRGLDGKRVHCSLIDELHEHPSSIVADKMRAGTKGSRNALIFEITNSGVDRQSVCYQHHEYSIRVVTGLVKDDSWFAYVCAMDEDDDPMVDEKCWVKANPLLGVTIELRYLRELQREAQGMPAKESIVRRLNFCQWVDAENPWIDGTLWRKSETLPADWNPSREIEPVAGLDLSGTKDLTALGIVWPASEGPVFARVEFWTPRDTLYDRAKADKVPYDVWVKDGHVIATPGRAVDLGFVAQRISDLRDEIGLHRVAYDAYKIKYLEQELDELGVSDIELIPHGQGWYKSASYKDKDGKTKPGGLWMPHSIEVTETLITTGRLHVLKNPALTFASASAIVEMDPQENRRFTKRKSKGRIDGIVALAMAVGLADEATEEENEPGVVLL